MELFKKYVEELHNSKSVYYNDKGFAVYWIRNLNDKELEVYIEDIYVKPEYRRTRAAHILADEVVKIAREKGCKYMTGSVIPSANNSTISLDMMRSYNFQLHSCKDNIIWFIKEI